MKARFKKLKNGEWGASLTATRDEILALEPGHQVTISKRAGGENKRLIDEVLWSGESSYVAGSWGALVSLRAEPKRCRGWCANCDNGHFCDMCL